jgi:hypothetical protein
MAVERNIRFLWDNRWLDAAVITASSEASGYPISCLQDSFRSRKWRSTSITGQSISIDFGSSKNFNALALIDHNLSITGTIRITASDSPGGRDLLDLNVPAWIPIIGFGEGYADDWGAGGWLLEADRSWFVPNPIRIIYREELAKYGTSNLYGGGTVYGQPEENAEQIRVTARYVTLEFTDDANPDGYIELGRLFICQFIDLGLNFQSISHGTVDESEIIRSLGGQAWVTKQVPLRRTIELQFDALQYVDKYWTLKLMAEKMGITGLYIIDCFPSNDLPSQRHHSVLYGRFQDMPSIEQNSDMGFVASNEEQGRQVSSTSITFEEEIV